MKLPSTKLMTAMFDCPDDNYICWEHKNCRGIEYTMLPGSFNVINRFEFMFEMKVFILGNDIVEDMDIYQPSAGNVFVELVGECKDSGESGCVLKHQSSPTEYEAVLLLAEWLVDKEVKDENP